MESICNTISIDLTCDKEELDLPVIEEESTKYTKDITNKSRKNNEDSNRVK